MSKGIYIGNSNAKKVKKMYLGNGTSRKVKKGYIGVGNTARLFYSSGYVWKKYNTTEKNIYYWDRYQALSSWDYSQYNRPNLGWRRFPNTVKCYAQTTREHCRVYNYDASPDIQDNGIIRSLALGDLLRGTTESTADNFHSGTCLISNYRYDEDEDTLYLQVVPTPDSRNVEEIQYMDYCTFVSGSRWEGYNFYKSNTRGNYIDEVSSTSSGSYPLNGVSGNYWYVYDRQDISYSQGSYIQDVENDNPNAYPDNGRHSDGYWYIKQNE